MLMIIKYINKTSLYIFGNGKNWTRYRMLQLPTKRRVISHRLEQLLSSRTAFYNVCGSGENGFVSGSATVILTNDISCMCLLTIIRLWFPYRLVAGTCVVTCAMNRASKDAGPSRAGEDRWCFPV